MTAERDTVSVGSCPTCHGPAQFIAADEAIAEGRVPASAMNLLDASSVPVGVRHVALPNIEEDLGGGWVLMEVGRLLHSLMVDRQWRAVAEVLDGRLRGDIKYAFGDSPSAAYLALRTAIEKRSTTPDMLRLARDIVPQSALGGPW